MRNERLQSRVWGFVSGFIYSGVAFKTVACCLPSTYLDSCLRGLEFLCECVYLVYTFAYTQFYHNFYTVKSTQTYRASQSVLHNAVYNPTHCLLYILRPAKGNIKYLDFNLLPVHG